MTTLLANSTEMGLGFSNPNFFLVKRSAAMPLGNTHAVNSDALRDESSEEQRSEYIRANTLPPIEQQIIDIASMCRQADWDGYDAAPISIGSAKFLYELLQKLPFTSFPTPEIGADPDGEMNALWSGADGASFSVSVSAEGSVAYAMYKSGSAKFHGIGSVSDDFSFLACIEEQIC